MSFSVKVMPSEWKCDDKRKQGAKQKVEMGDVEIKAN